MEIKQTSDYSVFRHVTGNREVNKSHVKRLLLTFGSNPKKLQWVPILVNENMEVIDGQHRLEASKKLEVPIYYRVINGLTLEDCQALNSNSKMWSPTDYAKAYCENGNQNYCDYLTFKSKTKLNHDIVMRYLSLDNPVTVQSFKDGQLEVQDYKKSELLASQLQDLSQGIKNYRLRAIALKVYAG